MKLDGSQGVELDGCLLRDRDRFARRFAQLQRVGEKKPGASRDGRFTRLLAEVEASKRERSRRSSREWRFTWPAQLPISSARDELARVIESSQVVVVTGSTGSGKSTGLPKLCLELGRGVSGMIGLTQPRRVAAREIATYLASELGSELGDTVGFQVRFQDHAGTRTQVKVMTDGVLLASLSRDRCLDSYDTLIVDEVHERTVNIDLLLGYLKTILPRRPDLRILLASATADAARWSELFDDAPILGVEGRGFPIETRWCPPAAELECVDAVVDAVARTVADESGDILVFLPGEREIHAAAGLLRRRFRSAVEVLPLFARLTPADQKKVFAPGRLRRVILATNVAETSLTVPRVRFVIDSGLARVRRYSYRSGVERLPIEPISQASANQRQGRCGRERQGVCIRLYSHDDFLRRPPFVEPELRRCSLPAVLLRMKVLALGNIEQFPFLDRPDPKAIRDGEATLSELGAIDASGALTPVGRQMARFPVDPHLARMLIEAQRRGCLEEALVVTAFLAVDDPRTKDGPGTLRRAAEEKAVEARSDFAGILELWGGYRREAAAVRSRERRAYCQREGLSYSRMNEWHSVHRQLSAVARTELQRPRGTMDSTPQEGTALVRSVLAGLPVRVGHRGRGREYEGPRGLSFELGHTSALRQRKPRWVVATEIVETHSRFASTAAEIKPQWILEACDAFLHRRFVDPRWDPARGQAVCTGRTVLYGLEIPSGGTLPLAVHDQQYARRIFLEEGLGKLSFSVLPSYLCEYERAIACVRGYEARLRRGDLLIGSEARAQWFESRIPESIVDRRSLDGWVQSQGRTGARALTPSRSELMNYELGDQFSSDFPEHFHLGALRADIHYEFDALGSNDGVTIAMPLAMAAAVTVGMLERSVPGRIPEVIESYWLQLPRRVRAALLDGRSQEDLLGDLFVAVCASDQRIELVIRKRLSSLKAGGAVSSMLTSAQLPIWLKPRLIVCDSQGSTLAEGRDLELVLNSVRSRSREELHTEVVSELTVKFSESWSFGPLLQTVRGPSGFDVVPALALRDSGAELKVFESHGAALESHRVGVRRLLRNQCRQQERLVEQNEDFKGALLMALGLGSSRGFAEDLFDLIADDAFGLQADAAISDEDAFKRRLGEGRGALVQRAQFWAREIGSLLKLRRGVLAEIAPERPLGAGLAGEDLRRQLGRLFSPGFIRETSSEWLKELPRYLKAAERRVVKLREGSPKDTMSMGLVQEYESRLPDSTRSVQPPAGGEACELETFRWWIEEYRVSLFAQDLGTKVPISAKRLDQQWHRALKENPALGNPG